MRRVVARGGLFRTSERKETAFFWGTYLSVEEITPGIRWYICTKGLKVAENHLGLLLFSG